MIKKILLSIILTVFILPISLYADNEVSSIAQNWFTNYSQKISIKYTTEKEISFFETFSIRLENLLIIKDFTEAQKILVKDLIKLSNEFVFTHKKYELEKNNKIILNSNSLLADFKYFSYNKESIFIENGVWYTYTFNSRLVFPKGVDIKKSDLEANGINSNTTLVILNDDNTLGFVTEYKKVKLISDSIIYGIPGKYNFIKEVKDDKKILNNETDNIFITLKNISRQITDGKTESEKIKIIYNYILTNIEYTRTFSLSDAEIFSGINTFINKDGVCEGYVKMFLYMLNFSGIDNSEVIRGYVLDAQDFPKIGHAWIKIGEKYYDPTFDDPIGLTNTPEYSEYIYFGLPYDLFYTNRYNFDTIPTILKENDLAFRENFIVQKTILLVEKYKNSGYNILRPYVLKLNYGIALDKILDLNDLKKILGYYEVNNNQFTKDGIINKIKSLNYYILNDTDNIEAMLDQINYNLNGYYLFKWKLDDGTYEYRLAYNLVIIY